MAERARFENCILFLQRPILFNMKIQLTCPQCNNLFQVEQYENIRNISLGRKTCCSRKCSSWVGKNPKVKINCLNCNKLIYRQPSQLSLSGKNFCSQSCAATYNNKHKTYGTRRSKLESFLEQVIKENFPNLEFKCNSKEEIGSELDFYFPSLKLAIEINGIYHYEPIHGKDKLTQIQNNDKSKLRACDEKGIDLIIISDYKSNFTKKIKEQFKQITIDIINKRK